MAVVFYVGRFFLSEFDGMCVCQIDGLASIAFRSLLATHVSDYGRVCRPRPVRYLSPSTE